LIKITLPDDIQCSVENRQKIENTVLNAAERLSKDLDITGLSEIVLAKNIPSLYETPWTSIGGEVITNNLRPPNFTIKLVGTILDASLVTKKETFQEFLNAFRHELAHINDHHKIPHIYESCRNHDDKPEIESVSWSFALKIWSEFMATHISSNILCIENVKRKIANLNDMCLKMREQKQTHDVKLIADILCCMTYLIGDIMDKNELANELDIKIEINEFTPILERLHDELSSLLKSYPNWSDKSVLKNLKEIFCDFINKNY